MQMRYALVYMRHGGHQCEPVCLKHGVQSLEEPAPCLCRDYLGIRVDDKSTGVFRGLTVHQVRGAIVTFELAEREVMQKFSMLDVLKALYEVKCERFFFFSAFQSRSGSWEPEIRVFLRHLIRPLLRFIGAVEVVQKTVEVTAIIELVIAVALKEELISLVFEEKPLHSLLQLLALDGLIAMALRAELGGCLARFLGRLMEFGATDGIGLARLPSVLDGTRHGLLLGLHIGDGAALLEADFERVHLLGLEARIGDDIKHLGRDVLIACREVERFHLLRREAAIGETQHRLRVHTESEAGAHGLHDRHGTGWVA